jgi:hypothetical protein
MAALVGDNTALVYDTFHAASAAGFLFDNAGAFYGGAAGVVARPAPVPLQEAPATGDGVVAAAGEASSAAPPRRKRRRRAKSCKSREEAECQRMTHIAVERNRRRQMNEYLVQLRSLMPESYVQRVRTSLSFLFSRALVRQTRRKGRRSNWAECFLGTKETRRHFCVSRFPMPNAITAGRPRREIC